MVTSPKEAVSAIFSFKKVKHVVGRVIIWTGAGLTLATGLSPTLTAIPSERTHEDYEKGLADIALQEGEILHSKLVEFTQILDRRLGIKSFVVSSNVDGFLPQFGFNILEIHGSVRYYQCSAFGNCGDASLYAASDHSRPGSCLSCAAKLRVAVTTAMDEDDDLVLSRHAMQVKAFREFAENTAGDGRNDSILHLIFGVGPSNKDSLLSEILLYEQYKQTTAQHISIWFNKKSVSAPTGLANAFDVSGDLKDTLPSFIDAFLTETADGRGNIE